MREKICGIFKKALKLVKSFFARIPAYLIPIVASVVLVIVLCVLVLCLSDKWESCIPSKMVPDYKESDGMVSFFWNDFNFYGIVATVLALFSLWYTFRAYRSQSLTESNTRNVSIEEQKNRFEDLARHEYRNLVVVLSTAVKYFSKTNQSGGQRMEYPSESHILKLQAAPEDFVLDIGPQIAAIASEMRLLLRNYNIEIGVAHNHLLRRTINSGVIEADYDNLIFKPLFLVSKSCRMDSMLSNVVANPCFSIVKEEEGVEKSHKDNKLSPKDSFLLRSLELMLTEHLSKLPKALKELIDKMDKWKETTDKHGKYLSYFKTLKKTDGFELECDHTDALKRSFGNAYGTLVEKFGKDGKDGKDTKDGKGGKNEKDSKILNCKWNYKSGENSEIEKEINSVLKNLPDLKKISPKDFEWLEAYKNMLQTIMNKDEFDLMQFFPLMLKMDILVELPKIGMVNYE